MRKQIFKNCTILLALLALVMVSGCKTMEKKEASPDRFEKWRVKAEDSWGNTPSPKQYDIDLKKKQREKKETHAQLIKKKPVKAIKRLPVMPVTMKMHDVSVSVLLRTLARAAKVNIMINESVTGQARINIKDIPWNQAFEGLLNTYGLTYEWSGDILRVITVEDLNKDIALMEAKQKFEKSKKEHSIAMLAIEKEEAKLEPLITKIVKIDYADITSLRSNLETYLTASKKDSDISKSNMDGKNVGDNVSTLRGSILMDASTNSLILQATQKDINKIMPIIRRIDRPTEQILIEAHIVEANSDTAKELGVQWGGLGLEDYNQGKNLWLGGPVGTFDSSLVTSTKDATTTSPAGTPIAHLPGIGNGINFPSSSKAGTPGWEGMAISILHEKVGNSLLYAQLTALEREGKLNILSKPSITTMDHRKATIESGKEVPFQTVVDKEIKIEWKKAVIKLEVTPHVINKQVLRLEILTHKDELDWSKTVAGNPTIITKNAQTRVALYDGQTTVIGGLNKEKVNESEAGVPWLKDIPGLGRLFRNNSNSADMEELLIFITPHILKEKGSKPTRKNG